MKRIILILSLTLGCLCFGSAEASAQQVLLGYRTMVDYYGNYYRVPVYGPAQTYQPPANGYGTLNKLFQQYQENGTVSNESPATRAAREANRERQEKLRREQEAFEKRRLEQWVRSFKTGG